MEIADKSVSKTIKQKAKSKRQRILDLCRSLVEIETPSNNEEKFSLIFDLLDKEFNNLGFETHHFEGEKTAGSLYAIPTNCYRDKGNQLFLGHVDTVHPEGTLDNQPFIIDKENNRAEGPGIFDMKCGIAQLIVALEMIKEIQKIPKLNPIVLINSDEEIGSIESSEHIKRLSKKAERAFILEPAEGQNGKIKTARKGIGHYEIKIEGKSSHAGLSPEKGSSAITELTNIIQNLNSLNNPEEGITVNVGVIEGGTRPNVIASNSRAEVDIRVRNNEQANRLDKTIRKLEPEQKNTKLSIKGGFRRPPMEKTLQNKKLWKKIKQIGKKLELDLEQTRSGGGSDGNITSQHTATVDGLGAVGGGAHESYEYIIIDKVIERTSLLSMILISE